MHKHLQRLERSWVEPPIYFITTCTEKRHSILAQQPIAEILLEEWRAAENRHGWLVGRYVIMPDHVHFFCAPCREAKSLSDFVGNWKRWTSRRIHALGEPGTARPGTTSPATGRVGTRAPFGQAEFFDHLIRSDESYDEKWNYVRENPLRAGLVSSAELWPYAGEITALRR